jgi:NAD(P)-dependent dehydrogenase (short-subunit alcohol dehydrogenase family)
MPVVPGSRPLAGRARDLRHAVLTLGSRTPNTPARIVRRIAAGGLAGAVGGRVVLVTGASSGIGEATALRLGAAGATVILVARSEDALRAVAARIEAAGGRADVRPCDLTDLDAVGRLTEAVLAEHGTVDVLVNNAGRSIRRSIADSVDRMHDFERTMQINYYGPVKLTLGLLPAMRARGRGQIVNVLSEGLLLQTPRFSAYLASKSALDAFSRCVANEVRPDGVRITGIHMPLVRTPMIAPTAHYERVPALRPEEGADLVCEGIVTRAYAVTPREGIALALARSVAPGTLEAGIALVTRRLGGPVASQVAGDEASADREATSPR